MTVTSTTEAVFIPVSARATSICPRCDWSDRRPIPLDEISILSGNGLRDFLPLSAAPPFLAGQESLSRPSSTALQPSGCRSIASGPSTVIEVAMGAARDKE